ncbi:Sulfotransferase [Trinorchestia longiramus]|nr:Sulfotransferase [Trinorchestia longiramus]
MTGVSFHSESGHIEILSKRLHKNEDYADSQHLSSTESIVKYEENNTNCYNLGDEGKSVSPQHYRTCIKMIMQDSLRLANLSKTNNKLLEMTERLRVYEQACRQPVAEVTGAPDFQDVVFDPKHKLSYCKTAKTGSSTILSFIFYIDDIDFDPRNQIGLHKAAQMTFPALPGRHGAWKMTNDAYTFTSVRHPFHRLVSAYCNKVVESKEHILKQHNHVMLSYRLANTLDIIRKELPNHYFEANDPSRRKASMLKLPRKFILSTPGKSKFLEIPGEPENLSPEVPSFREFMLFVALNILQCAGDHICLNELDTHFRPQVIRCNPCAWHFDFILKTETLQDDLVWLAGVVGATSAISSSHQRTRGTQLTGDIPKLNTRDTDFFFSKYETADSCHWNKAT